MEILTFLYNIILIILYTVVLSCSVMVYLQKKRPLFLLIATLFLLFIFDNIIIYMTEFLDEFSMHYDLQFMSVPAFKTVIIIASCFCLSRIQGELLPQKPYRKDLICLSLLALTLLFIPMYQDGALKVWLYYLPFQLYTLYLGVSGFLYIKKKPDSLDIELLPRYRGILLITIIFSVLIVIEDTVVIFSYDVYSNILVKINNRSISEDIMSILYSICAISYLLRGFHLYTGNEILVTAPPSAPPAAAPTPAPLETNSIDSNFLCFANQYQLTSREKDIMRILLKDKNNQEISEELFISIGTVKTHVHNIFQKVGVARRSQLLRIYNDFNNTNGQKYT